MKTAGSVRRPFAAILGALCTVATGCTLGDDRPETDAGTHVFIDAGAPSTHIGGFSYDPEAFFLNLTACGSECQSGPVLSPNSELFVHSTVHSGTVGMFDPVSAAELGQPASGAADGLFDIPALPNAAPLVFPTLSNGQLTDAGTLPPVKYVKTLTYRPVVLGNAGGCFFVESAAISEVGILSAVAKFLSSEGTATTVADLTNPAKFGGVAIVWMFQPAYVPIFRVPSSKTTVTQSDGRLLHLDWAPPGDPGAPAQLQSARGFFVAKGDTTSNLGLAVVLLPPSKHELRFTATDTVTSSIAYRPWTFPAVDLHIPAGSVAYAPLIMLPIPDPTGINVADPLPDWVCYP